jgi:hypothetical protein
MGNFRHLHIEAEACRPSRENHRGKDAFTELRRAQTPNDVAGDAKRFWLVSHPEKKQKEYISR